MRNLRITALAGLVIFSVFVAMNNAIAAHSRATQDSAFNDPVSNWEKRVESVLNYIPGDTNTIGYVADWDIPGVEYNLVDQETEYTLTQYALAPRSVQPGWNQEWIIGNFTSPGFRDWLDQHLHSYEITEIGFGIYVIHRISS